MGSLISRRDPNFRDGGGGGDPQFTETPVFQKIGDGCPQLYVTPAYDF